MIVNQQLSPEFVSEVFKQQSSRAVKNLIDIYIKEGVNETPQVYHFVDDFLPVRFRAEEDTSETLYQPASFRVTLGQDEADKTPDITMTFDSGDRDTIRRLRRAEGQVIVRLSVVLVPQGLQDPLITHREWGPHELIMSEFDFKATAITAKLIAERFLTEPAPTVKMNPTIAPGLFDNRVVNG